MEPARQAANYLLTGCRVDPPVKNTFIHFNFGTNEKDAVPEAEDESSVLRSSYHRSHSDPVHGEGSTSEHSTSGVSSSKQSSLHSWLQSGRAQGSFLMSEARSSARSSSPSASGNSLSSDAEVAKSEGRDYGGATGSHAPLTQGSKSEAVIQLPEGIPSIGALGHERNTCKPCAWNWKPGGCVNRENCDFCHLCATGELKQRRKERVAILRKSEKEDKRKMAKAGAVDGRGSDSGSLYASASSGHENASNMSESATSGYGSSASSLLAHGASQSSTTIAEVVAPATPPNYQMAKKNTRISL